MKPIRILDFLLGVGAGFAAAYLLHTYGGGIGQIAGRKQNPGNRRPNPSRVPPAVSGVLSSLAQAGFKVWEARAGEAVKYFAQSITQDAPAFEVDVPDQGTYEGGY